MRANLLNLDLFLFLASRLCLFRNGQVPSQEDSGGQQRRCAGLVAERLRVRTSLEGPIPYAQMRFGCAQARRLGRLRRPHSEHGTVTSARSALVCRSQGG